jgi:hypothetical protein
MKQPRKKRVVSAKTRIARTKSSNLNRYKFVMLHRLGVRSDDALLRLIDEELARRASASAEK